MNKFFTVSAVALFAAASGLALSADEPELRHHPHMAGSAGSAQTAGAMTDDRLLVKYPEMLRIHTLANMRDHLVTLGQIQEALSTGDFDQASTLAEQRLGMSSLESHGALEVARYMPKGMQEAGTAMHRSASQLARVTKDASVTGDVKPVLASLARLSQTCVACHGAYRLQ